MHFSPSLNRQLQTCARIREHNTSLKIMLNGKKLKKVRTTKFLGVVIDDQLTWEPHVDFLTSKLNSSMVTIKRIKPFIPKSEYLKIYNSLFLSHLSYCISCWGGIPTYKLDKVFAIQKRCIRLLFGKDLTYDHHEFYLTCARARTIDEHKAPKNYTLEHTKPIFNEHKIMSLKNVYYYHTFMELFKILKYNTPISLSNLFKFCPRNEKLLLMAPKVRLEVKKQNFVYKATKIWNELIKNILAISPADMSGLIIPGSVENSDLGASTGYVKSKLKAYLLNCQIMGHPTEW